MPDTVRHDAFCPNCGVPRMGAFRFCRECRFDFDTYEGFGPGPRPFRIDIGAAWRPANRSRRGVIVGDGAFELSQRATGALILVVAAFASLLVVVLSR